MRCPFLREAQVKFCKASAFKKMIVRTPLHPENEKCSSPEYVTCPAAKQYHEELPSQSHCPFLQESLAQYCSAAAVTKYVPYSESVLSRCGNESHRYCELYQALAHPALDEVPSLDDHSAPKKQKAWTNEHEVEGVRMPSWLAYSSNHMWLDSGADGSYHVGVDAFFSRAFGTVERVDFVSGKGVTRPAAVFTVNGVDFQLVFPQRMLITSTNAYLRYCPDKLYFEPYNAAWLFEGKDLKDASTDKGAGVSDGLLRDEKARTWMSEEVHRLSTFVHDQYSRREGLMMDGGQFADGFAQLLGRDELLQLCNEFFSPYSNWRY